MLTTYICIVLLGPALLWSTATGQSSLPVAYNVTTLPAGEQQCPSDAERSQTRARIIGDLRTILQNDVIPTLQLSSDVCGQCGGSGWTRVVYLNMSNTTQQCPGDWALQSTPVRTCGSISCTPVYYSVSGMQYREVCGRIEAYFNSHPDGFLGSTFSIDGTYVDGVSLTHGSPREHIWTFAAADGSPYCPCDSRGNPSSVPSFVGSDYFCEYGTSYFQPLWDGEGCSPTGNCCSFNSPPWFNKRLPQTTTDNLELRSCGGSSAEINFIGLIEICIR